MKKTPAVVAAIFTGILAGSAQAQVPPSDKAQALLQEVRSQALDRQRATQQKELERLKEDLEKGRKEAQEAQRSVDQMHAAIREATDRLGKFTAQKLQLTKTTEVVSLQLEAERIKLEGLKMLSDAQLKGALALAKRADQTEMEGAIEQAKMNTNLQPGDSGKRDGVQEDQAAREMERKLAKSERAASIAKSAARDAMKAATAKLQEANLADEKAKQRAAELGIVGQFAPTPAMETVEPLKDIDPVKADAAPAPLAQ